MLHTHFQKQMKLLSSTRSAGNKLHNLNANWGAVVGVRMGGRKASFCIHFKPTAGRIPWMLVHPCAASNSKKEYFICHFLLTF